jgi:hypothetical protein
MTARVLLGINTILYELFHMEKTKERIKMQENFFSISEGHTLEYKMSMMGKIHQLKSYYIHTLLYEEET